MSQATAEWQLIVLGFHVPVRHLPTPCAATRRSTQERTGVVHLKVLLVCEWQVLELNTDTGIVMPSGHDAAYCSQGGWAEVTKCNGEPMPSLILRTST